MGSFAEHGRPLRIAVIGTQTADPESAKPYTVYRTVVTYEGECYQRLLRYSEFYRFYKKLKLREANPMRAAFPGKTWTRQTVFDDDLIEARQVMLNEFMKEVATKKLTAQSEMYLMSLLKIGKYEDGSGRVSDMSSFKASFIVRNDRGVMEVLPEAEEEVDHVDSSERRGSTFALRGAATLAATLCTFPAVSSNASTVLVDDEPSSSQTRRDEEEMMLAEQDAIAADAQTSAAAASSPEHNGHSSREPLQRSSTIAPSSYSENLLKRPALRASQSLPVRRSKHVAFPTEVTAATSDTTPTEGGELSPETKYRDRISLQLNSISRLLSESDGDAKDLSTRSALALTA